MQSVVYITVALVITCLHASPIVKRSTNSGAAVAEFNMPKDKFYNYPWTTKNATLEDASSGSKSQYGNSIECPSQVLEGDQYPLHMRSTCPWYYEADHVSTRYPTTILKAYPACEYCIGSAGLQCEPIRRAITILEKKTTADNTVIFAESEIQINVGFTCAGARTVSNGTPAPVNPAPGGDGPVFA